jgi:hypothetical protein
MGRDTLAQAVTAHMTGGAYPRLYTYSMVLDITGLYLPVVVYGMVWVALAYADHVQLWVQAIIP